VLRLLPFEHQARLYRLITSLGLPCASMRPFQQEDGAVGKLLDQTEIVRDEEHRNFALAKAPEICGPQAVREDRISNGERFIHDENFRDRHGWRWEEREADVTCQLEYFLDGALHELANLREGLDGGHRFFFRSPGG